MERAEAEAILDGDRETAVALLMKIGELVEANQRLEARVAELERRLNRSSRNSSLPPSQDPPSAPARPKGPGSGRKPGRQLGHEGRHRRLLPPAQVDEVLEHWPGRCRSCAHLFGETDRGIRANGLNRHALPFRGATHHSRDHAAAPHEVRGRATRAVSAAEAPRGTDFARAADV